MSSESSPTWDEDDEESNAEDVSPGRRLVSRGAEEPSRVATDAWMLDAVPT